ncbi:hypothetical protein A9K55_003594 [Cordyceps militaris]|uniref:Uncharacterized protein n=1 Tax=Cordyceps militaris TaxID=73501 RepID=A0A2H4S9F3_CORMI|nr:hypothetical protein A9K55_003594 [Cordyceps militaris]
MQVSQNSSFAVPGLALPSHVHSEPTERVHLVQLPRDDSAPRNISPEPRVYNFFSTTFWWDVARREPTPRALHPNNGGDGPHAPPPATDFPNFDTGPCYGVDGGRARQGTNAMCTP